MKIFSILCLALAPTLASSAQGSPSSSLRGVTHNRRRANFLWWGKDQQTTDTPSNNAAVKVNVINTEYTGGTAALRLYLHDKRLADAPAALAATALATIPAGETSTTVTMYPDLTVEQVGKTYEEMIEPSLYITLDVEASSLTYTPDSPTFDFWLGDTVDLKLRPNKELHTENSDSNAVKVNVINTEGTGGTASLRVYLNDMSLADAPAALAATAIATIPDGEASIVVTLYPDLTVEQVGRTHEEMIEPSLYVALDIDAGSLTYTSEGPTFDFWLGDTVDLKLRPKDETTEPQDITVNVKNIGGTGGTAALSLYLYDKYLADAPATLVNSVVAQIQEGETFTTVSLTPNYNKVDQAGNPINALKKPSLYLALDVSASTLTYVDGPAYDIQPGQTVDLEFKPKESGAKQQAAHSTTQSCPDDRKVQVSVQVAEGPKAPESATILLYLYDEFLADAAAVLVASELIEIPAGYASATIVELCADLSHSQEGKTHDEMEKASFYIALDFSEESNLTYQSGPAFDVQLGGTAELKLKPKET